MLLQTCFFFFFHGRRKLRGKRENADYQHFPHFFHMKSIFLMVVKSRYCAAKSLYYSSVFEGVCVIPFPNKPWFLRILSTYLLKTLRKGEIARNEQFLLFSQCFLPFWRTFHHFHQIQNCHLQTLSFWKSIKCVVWKRVKQNQM